MRTRTVLMVALALALALAVPGRAAADWDDRPDADEYESELSSNGYWVDDAQFGHVWRPYVDWGWRPYVDGRWVWSSYGWTWASGEPWGWTFHYGRWGWSNLYGWVWTPGYVWGPAWVDWYWGDGFVGWVPLGPPGFAIVPTYWTYVHDYHFCSPRVTTVIVRHDFLPGYIFHHREQGWGRRHAPDFREIEHVSRHRIERASDRPRDSVAPWVQHRIERGERVRERIADRGEERVIDHPGKGRDLDRGRDRQGPGREADRRHDADAGRDATDRGHADRGPGLDRGRDAGNDRDHHGAPPVVDDGGWRRPGRERGPEMDERGRADHRGVGGDDRGLVRPDDDRRPPMQVDRPPIQIDRRPRGDDRGAVRPQRPDPDERAWNRPATSQPQHPTSGWSPRAPERTTPPPTANRGGSSGGPVVIDRGRGSGGDRPAPPTGGGGRGDDHRDGSQAQHFN